MRIDADSDGFSRIFLMTFMGNAIEIADSFVGPNYSVSHCANLASTSS